LKLFVPYQLPANLIVAVSGGRDFSDDELLVDTLNQIHAAKTIGRLIDGACPVGDGGADQRAHHWAIRNEVNALRVPPKAKRLGWPHAGPARNREIGRLHPHLWIFFPGDSGTASARRMAIEYKIPRLEVQADGKHTWFV
jgi:hypothetical protein